MVNVVEIVVRATDLTKEGFASASATSAGFSAKMAAVGMVGAAALGGIAVASVDMAAKFDSSMTMLQTQAGVSKQTMQQLSAGVLNLAGQVGFSPDSLAEAAYHVASNMSSMGATSTQMLNAVKVAAEGAAVGHADLVDVTNALGAAIASGMKGTQDYSQAMGVLNATVGAGDMKMQDLANAFGSGLLATVKGFGVSITDVGAALAVFGDNNIRGAQAGTELRMAIQSLASPAKSGTDTLKSLGLTTTQLATDMQHGGLNQAITDLRDHMIKAGDTGDKVGTVLTDAFGKKAGAGINILVDQYGRLQSKYPELEKGANSFGAAVAQNNQTLSQKMKDLEANFQALAIQLGNKLMPAAQAVFGYLAGHADVVAKVATGVLAAVAALAAYALIAKTVAVAQGILDAAMDANPIVLIVAAIAALAVGFTIAWQKSAPFRVVLQDIGSAMLSVGILIIKGAKGITDAWLSMVGSILHGAVDAFGWVPGLGGKLHAASAAFDDMKSHVDGSFTTMIGSMQSWQNQLTGAGRTAANVSSAISADFAGQAKAAKDAGTALDNYTNVVKSNGVGTAAEMAARQQLVSDLTTAGVNATTAQRDVAAYTTAVANNGATSSQAAGARTKLINDILAVSNNAKQGKSDLANFTSAVKENGSQSSAAQGARAKLIADLIAAGVSSSTAKGLVDSLQKSISALSGKTVGVNVVGSGSGKITFAEQNIKNAQTGFLEFHAAGGRVGGSGNSDSVMAMLTPGEVVIPKRMVAAGAVDHLRGKLPGFAGGGLVDSYGVLSGAGQDFVGSAEHQAGQAVAAAASQAMLADAQAKVAAMVAAAAAVFTSRQVGGNVGSGVTQWAGLVAQALAMEGLSASLENNVLYQMQTESGGNPNAINNSDSNAAAGDPSRGLMQTIGSTFSAYHWPGTSNNIYDPLANIAAALNYAKHVYGPSLMSGGMGIGSGHGYAAGGATSAGWAMLGERGRELVKLPGGANVYPAGASAQMAAGGTQAPALVQLEVSSGGQSAFEQFMLEAIRNWVRIKGGGNVQTAFGRNR